MPNFEARVTAGVTLQAWEDPVGAGSEPSRVNPMAGYPMKRYVGTVGTEISVDLYIGAAPVADAGLGGDLFAPWTVEAPHPYPVAFSNPSGWTAKQRFTPTVAGHYCLGFRRPSGGAYLVHVDAEAP